MSSYAYDPDRGALITVWRTPSGGTRSRDLVTAPTIAIAAADELTRALAALEAAIWRVYDRPAHEATGDDSEETVRAAEYEALTRVAAAVRQPRRPDDDYGLTVSHVAVDERANQVGRALDGLPEQWRDVVADDLEEEADAVRRASLGDYAGRAAQAVWRDRLEVAPSQVTAALDALQATDDPIAHVGQLPGNVGVMAAAAAAGVLLTAAAEATAAVWGGEPERVFLEADNIEAVSVEVPTTVVAGIRHGIDPGDVIVSLVSDALTVRDGWVPDLDVLAGHVADAEERAAALESQWPGTVEALREEASRLTSLDTARPAADLFEHLADGLNATRVLYAEAMLERHPPGPYDDEEVADQARVQQWQARWVADTATRLAAWRADAS